MKNGLSWLLILLNAIGCLCLAYSSYLFLSGSTIVDGSKEPNMKKASEKLRRAFPAAEDHPFEGMGHGDIIGHPELMTEEIRKFMER